MSSVLINSLPKAGTHLLVKLLEGMGYKYSGANFSSTTLYGRHELPKYLLRGVFAGQAGIEVGLDIATAARSAWVSRALKNVEAGQFCGGHLPYSDGMHSLVQEANLRTLHILRDPRDVLVSWAHYVPTVSWHYGRPGLMGSDLDGRVRKLLYGYRSGTFTLESFTSILNRSNGWLGRPGVMAVRFEDLVGEKGGGGAQEQVARIQEIGAFVGHGEIQAVKLSETLFGGTKVFRKGQIGSWREELSPTLAAEVNSVLKRELGNMNYSM